MPFVVAATWKAKPGAEEHVARMIDKMTPLARAEEKNLCFQPHVDPDQPGTFFLYEQYTDASGYEDHRATPHFRHYVLGEVVPHLESREIHTYQTLDI